MPSLHRHFGSSICLSVAFLGHVLPFPLSVVMPTIDRVDWAIRQLQMGRKVRISVGEAQDSTKMKINIFLEPAASVVASHHVCPAMAGFLWQIREWVVAYSCTNH